MNTPSMPVAELADVDRVATRRRLLILSDGFPPHDEGGAERIAYYQAHALKERGYEVAVFCSYPPGPKAAPRTQMENGIRVYRAFSLFPITRSGSPKKIDAVMLMAGVYYNPSMDGLLDHVIAHFKPDILHAHYIVRISYRAFARCAPELPRVITYHGYQFECPKGGLYRKRKGMCSNKPLPCRVYRDFMKKELARTDRIIAISRFIERRLIDAGNARERVVYLPNGVPNLEQREFTPLTDSHDVLYVGRIVHNKGLVELIRAFRSIDDAKARLIVVGDGGGRGAAEAAAAGDSRIHFKGWLAHDAVAEEYRKARVVVVPSLWHEVMNTVICEAQSWSRPVIATRVGGNSDLIEDGESGYLCEAGDVEQLGDRIRQLLEDDLLAERMSHGGFAYVERYGMLRHIDSIEALYRELC